jgi:site-specific DNA recombinase
MFEAAQQILVERGEDATRRRSNASDYLLSGRVVICAHCHSPYMGAAAHGRNARYRYYVCCSRQRGGLAKCSADRVPADALEQGVLTSLAQTFAQPDLIARAVEDARAELQTQRPDYEAELAQVQSEMRRTDENVQRYLLAFEAGTLPEAMCGERMRALADRLGELRARQAELEAAVDESPADDPWAAFDIEAVQADVQRLVAGEDDFTTRKALLRVFVEQIRVEAKTSIYPVFRVPATPVRLMSGLVGASGIEPETSAMSTQRSYQLSYAPTGVARPHKGRAASGF